MGIVKRILNKKLQATTKLLGCYFYITINKVVQKCVIFFYLYIADKTKIYLSKKKYSYSSYIVKRYQQTV